MSTKPCPCTMRNSNLNAPRPGGYTNYQQPGTALTFNRDVLYKNLNTSPQPYNSAKEPYPPAKIASPGDREYEGNPTLQQLMRQRRQEKMKQQFMQSQFDGAKPCPPPQPSWAVQGNQPGCGPRGLSGLPGSAYNRSRTAPAKRRLGPYNRTRSPSPCERAYQNTRSFSAQRPARFNATASYSGFSNTPADTECYRQRMARSSASRLRAKSWEAEAKAIKKDLISKETCGQPSYNCQATDGQVRAYDWKNEANKQRFQRELSDTYLQRTNRNCLSQLRSPRMYRPATRSVDRMSPCRMPSPYGAARSPYYPQYSGARW